MIAGLKILEVALPMIALTSPPDSAWCASSFHDHEDWSYAIVETVDHNFIQVGYTTPDDANNRDGWVVVIDSDGQQLWEKSYGGDREDVLLSVLNHPDGGFLIAGYTASTGSGQRDAWVLHTDLQGEVLWEKTYGGAGRDIAWDIKQNGEEGYVLSGNTESIGAGQMDGMLLCIDKNGDSLWTRSYGMTGFDELIHLTVLNDGYLLAGSTTSNSVGPRDGWVVKTDKQGNQLWSWKNHGIGTDVFRSALVLTDSTYGIVGDTDTDGAGSSDFWMVCLSTEGDSLWSRTYGGISREMCFHAEKVKDYAVLCGHTFSFGSGMADAWLLKVSAAGDSVWSRTFGGPLNDDVYYLLPTSDDGYGLCGYTNSFAKGASDFWLIKTGPDSAAIEWVTPDQATLLKSPD